MVSRVALTLFAAAAMAAGQTVPAPPSIPAPPPITVSAAISLTEALTAAAQEYGINGGGAVRFNFGASNVLARQIVAGAPVDVFISADESQMDVVAAAHMIAAESRVDLLRNQLAVVVPSDHPRVLSTIRELTDPAFRRIAIGDPGGVPAGRYAKAYLQQSGLWATLQPRIVPCGSVRAALATVEAGAADAAIVYRTDARISARATVAFVVPVNEGPAIRYPAAVVQTSKSRSAAQRFIDFLRSAPADRVFAKFGFVAVH